VLHNWPEVQKYHDQGNGFVACQKRFGFTHGAWNKAISRRQLLTAPRPFRDRRRRYDWAVIQAYYDEGYSYRDCRAKFGFNAMTWHKARLRGEIATRKHGMPIEELLTGKRARGHVKQRLLRAGLIQNRCQECGIEDWQGRRLTMQIDHINGIRNDHRLENLRMLCPNCHSQTETYGGRNLRRRRLQGEAPVL
jgi:5-methylcytosine-specific restriction endonuclease McrA